MKNALSILALSCALTACGTSEIDQKAWVNKKLQSIDFKDHKSEYGNHLKTCFSSAFGVAFASEGLSEEEKYTLMDGTISECFAKELTPAFIESAKADSIDLDSKVSDSTIRQFVLDMNAKDRAEKEAKRIQREEEKRIKLEKEKLAKERYEHAYNGGIDLVLPLYCASYNILDKDVYKTFSDNHIVSLQLDKSDMDAFNQGMEDAEASLSKKPNQYFQEICPKVAAKINSEV